VDAPPAADTARHPAAAEGPDPRQNAVAATASGFLAGHRDRTTAVGGRGKVASTMSRSATVNDMRKNGTGNDSVIAEKAGSKR